MKNRKGSMWAERERQREREREKKEREVTGEFQEEFIYGNKNFSIKTETCTFHLNVIFSWN